MSQKQTPSDFLKQIIEKPVVVKFLHVGLKYFKKGFVVAFLIIFSEPVN